MSFDMNACISQVRRFSITLVVLILLSVPAFPADAGTNQEIGRAHV
jgi:hypothetical protein